MLMMLAATGQVAGAPAAARRAHARLRRRPTAWLKAVLPPIYPQIRLPVYAVLAFSLSVVEVALCSAPGHAAAARRARGPLVRGLRPRALFPGRRGGDAPAAAGRRGDRPVAARRERSSRRSAAAGSRPDTARRRGGRSPAPAGSLPSRRARSASPASLVLALWAFARDWRFPDGLPGALHARDLARGSASLGGAPRATTLVAARSLARSRCALALACLENEQRRGLRPGAARALAALRAAAAAADRVPVRRRRSLLRAPRTSTRTLRGVVWAHLLFVLPYVFLSLADPYRALDPRYARIARRRSAPRRRAVFWRVKAAAAAAADPGRLRGRVRGQRRRSTCRPCSPAPAASRR